MKNKIDIVFRIFFTLTLLASIILLIVVINLNEKSLNDTTKSLLKLSVLLASLAEGYLLGDIVIYFLKDKW